MKYLWIEIAKFFKYNIKKIILGTVVLTALLLGVRQLFGSQDLAQLEEIEDEIDSEMFQLDALPAYFDFFVEYPDGSGFTNNGLVEQYLTLPDELMTASEETDTDLFNIVDKTDNTAVGLEDMTEESEELTTTKLITVLRNNHTNLMRFYVNIGNEDSNIDIANYYYDYIFGNNVPIFEDKQLFIFQEPTVFEVEEDNQNNESVVNTKENRNFVLLALFIVIISFILTTGLLILLSFFSKKLIYFYTYSIKDSDYFLLLDRKTADAEATLFNIENKVSKPNTVVVQQGTTDGLDQFISINSNNVYKNILEVDTFNNTDLIVYLIEEGVTTRDWYNKQREMDKLYAVPVLVVQINKNY